MLSQKDQEMMLMIKGKRSKRPRPTSSLALFTMSTTSTTSSTTTSSPLNSFGAEDGEEEEEEVPHHDQHHREDIEEDMANCLILLAKGQNPNYKPIIASSSSSNPENVSYQCKTCSKSFSSFQALGGHRASHKDRSSISRDQENPRDDYDRSVILSLQMSNRVDLNGNPNDCKYSNAKKSSRVHECSICGAEFASGQALGGHMRRHRAVSPAGAGGGESKRPRNLLALDLNLPAPELDRDRKIAFVPKEQVIAFSASSLVDCLY